MPELKLHVQLDSIAAKTDVVRWIGFVAKGQPEAKQPYVELDRPLDVPRAENRVRFFEQFGCSVRRGRGAPIETNQRKS